MSLTNQGTAKYHERQPVFGSLMITHYPNQIGLVARGPITAVDWLSCGMAVSWTRTPLFMGSRVLYPPYHLKETAK